MKLKVKYDVATGEILAWGEQLTAEPGTALLEDVDNDFVQYLRLIDAKVVNGKLEYDQAKYDAARQPQPPAA